MMVICPQCEAEYDGGTHLCAASSTDPSHLPADASITEPIERDRAAKPTAASHAKARVGEVVGSYRLLKVLGVGSFGSVYSAEHIHLGRRVALKLLRPEMCKNSTALKRFFGEARAVNDIAHENIVTISDFVENQAGQSYYIMPLLEGRILADVLKDGVPPLSRALDIGVQLCRGLQAVHDKGVVHRDLKPANVFLQSEAGGERVKLLDFGVAKLSGLADGSGRFAKTQAGDLMGTPLYMSPEQTYGGDVDHRSDIYAFGVVMYEMLAGRRPFEFAAIEELLDAHRMMAPAPPAQTHEGLGPFPEDLTKLVMACLAKMPADRPQSLREVGNELERIRARTARPRPNWRTPRVIAAAAFALGLMAMLVALSTRDEPALADKAVQPARPVQPVPPPTAAEPPPKIELSTITIEVEAPAEAKPEAPKAKRRATAVPRRPEPRLRPRRATPVETSPIPPERPPKPKEIDLSERKNPFDE